MPMGWLSACAPRGRANSRRRPDPAVPLRLITVAAARRDPAWLGLTLAADSEIDSTPRMAQVPRSGQMLRTPETRLGAGRLWYLVRGPGRAYAAVQSHLVIDGPLHSQTLLEWKAEDDAWRWIAHDLSAYPGHRLHVEFSPVGDAPLAIARVVESADPPRLDRPAIVAAPRDAGEAGAASAQQEAKACARALIAAVDAMAAAGKSPSALLPSDAALADWLLARIDRLAASDEAGRPWLSDEQRAAWRRLAEATVGFRRAEAELAGRVPKSARLAIAMLDGSGSDEPLLIRGNPRTPGDAVPRRPLEALAGGGDFQPGPGSGRLALAESLVVADNPLVARVLVNRVWHHLFGAGIVTTVDNFGVLGTTPSHPELLDHLARRFTADGWSLKRLIRELVMSRTYQMSSYPDAAADAADPGDALLHRMRLRRLDAEALRDAILTISGGLDPRQFGPSVPLHLTADLVGRGRPKVSGPLDGAGRRSIYLAVRRNFVSPMMLVFDFPPPATTVGRRNLSNVPAQALILLNDPFVDAQALAWARRMLAVDLEPAERIDRLYEAALARRPEPAERAAALDFLRLQAAQLERPGSWPTDERVWADLAHVLWNSKEFLFVR